MSQPETIADGLLAQHKLLVAVIHTDWATRLDHKVAAVIIERYMRKQGNSRASLRYLEKATGAQRPNIIASTRRLLEHGVFHVMREGAGTRPTEYGLNFQFSPSGIVDDTSSTDCSSGIAGDTAGGIAGNTSSGPSGIVDDTQTSLTVPGLQAGVQERENEPAAPTAPPPPPANAADGAGTAGDESKATKTTTTKTGFDELWNAYGYKRGKPEARRAYAKLAPDADLHAAMVASAIEWRGTWAAQGKPDAPRFTLTKWIEREEYECTPPTAYKAKERKKPAAANDDKPARGKGKLTEQLRLIETEFIGSPFGDYRMRIKLDGPSGEQEHVLRVLSDNGVGPDNDAFNKLQHAFGGNADEWPGQRLRLEMDGDHVVDIIPERKPDRQVEIAGADLLDMGDEKLIVLKFADADGKPEGGRDIVFEADDEYAQSKGRDELRELLSAVGLPSLSDTDELVGRRLLLTASDRFKIVEEAA